MEKPTLAYDTHEWKGRKFIIIEDFENHHDDKIPIDNEKFHRNFENNKNCTSVNEYEAVGFETWDEIKDFLKGIDIKQC